MTISPIAKIAQKAFKVKCLPDNSEELTYLWQLLIIWSYATGTRKNQNQPNKNPTKLPNNKQNKTN